MYRRFPINHPKTCLFSMAVLLTLITASTVSARPWRPNQIPNGKVYGCATCHINPAGGGARNPFGQAVGALVAPGSQTEFWSPALAALDSDGDGVTNGAELQDPNGTWKAGTADPGDAAKVTNPGIKDAVAAPFAAKEAFVAVLTGTKENPAVQTPGRGIAVLQLSQDEKEIQYTLFVFGLQNVTASHIHLGAANENGGVVYPLDTPSTGKSIGKLTITAADIVNLDAGKWYVNVHTTQNPNGEIRGQVVDKPIKFKSVLSGADEVPPNASGGSGTAEYELSYDFKQLTYTLTVSNLSNITAAHIHKAPFGQSGNVIITLASAPFTTITGTVDLPSENLDDLFMENLYTNVHTTEFPAGAIRGQVVFDVNAVDVPSLVNNWENYE